MANAGIFPGLNYNGWRDYVPLLRSVVIGSTASASAQPILLEGTAKGRWHKNNQGLVRFSAVFAFQSGDTFGGVATNNTWMVSLPYPANRSSGGADLPIGQAFMWQGPSANPSPNLIGQVSLGDPAGSWAMPEGQDDMHCQVFLSKQIAWGTGAFTSGTTTATITHGMGTGYIPDARDIHIVPTNLPSTNPQWINVANITSTTFDVALKASSTTTPVTFSWKIDSDPNNSVTLSLLLNNQRPWIWAAGHVLTIQGSYEARR